MEDRKILDLRGNEHYKILEQAFLKLDPRLIYNIMDAGSGKTSLSCLLSYFKQSRIDAYVYPKDERKISTINREVISNRYSLIEQDICEIKVTMKYDFILAHLILGEASKFGHSSPEMIDILLDLNYKYLLICDYVDDEEVDFPYLVKRLQDESKYEIIFFHELEKEHKFSFEPNRQKMLEVLIRKKK